MPLARQGVGYGTPGQREFRSRPPPHRPRRVKKPVTGATTRPAAASTGFLTGARPRCARSESARPSRGSRTPHAGPRQSRAGHAQLHVAALPTGIANRPLAAALPSPSKLRAIATPRHAPRRGAATHPTGTSIVRPRRRRAGARPARTTNSCPSRAAPAPVCRPAAEPRRASCARCSAGAGRPRPAPPEPPRPRPDRRDADRRRTRRPPTRRTARSAQPVGTC